MLKCIIQLSRNHNVAKTLQGGENGSQFNLREQATRLLKTRLLGEADMSPRDQDSTKYI